MQYAKMIQPDVTVLRACPHLLWREVEVVVYNGSRRIDWLVFTTDTDRHWSSPKGMEFTAGDTLDCTHLALCMYMYKKGFFAHDAQAG